MANRLSHRYGFGCEATPDEALVDDAVCGSIGVTEEWLSEMDRKAQPMFESIRKGLH